MISLKCKTNQIREPFFKFDARVHIIVSKSQFKLYFNRSLFGRTIQYTVAEKRQNTNLYFRIILDKVKAISNSDI
jgi:hypothetical protein